MKPEQNYMEEGCIQNVAKVEEPSTLSTVAFVAAVLALVLSAFTAVSCWALSREAKQVQIQLMYANAIMLREGLVQSGDQVYGPEGNLMYKQHELKRKP